MDSRFSGLKGVKVREGLCLHGISAADKDLIEKITSPAPVIKHIEHVLPMLPPLKRGHCEKFNPS